MPKTYMTGIALCAVAAMSWGISFPVMDETLATIDPFSFTAMRYSAAATIFVVLLISKEGTQALNLKGERFVLAWLLGSSGFCGYGFFIFHGQQLAGKSGALSASVMIATTPMLTQVLNWILRGSRPSATSFGCIVMSFVGVMLVLTKGNPATLLAHSITFESTAFLLLGAVSWAFYTVGGSFFPTWSAYRYTAITTLLGLITILASNEAVIALAFHSRPNMETVMSVLPHLFYMVLIAGVLAVLCWNMGNKIISPVNGVLFLDIVPLTAFAITALTGAPIDSRQLLGALLVGTSLLSNNLYQRKWNFASNYGGSARER
ncbi:DMT family transporter [Trinickia sp.]|uniref:DMT family transporter n=1 Tax=Trinickia sp. TaxID=2571163 RepID=UPI003F7D6CEC